MRFPIAVGLLLLVLVASAFFVDIGGMNEPQPPVDNNTVSETEVPATETPSRYKTPEIGDKEFNVTNESEIDENKYAVVSTIVLRERSEYTYNIGKSQFDTERVTLTTIEANSQGGVGVVMEFANRDTTDSSLGTRESVYQNFNTDEARATFRNISTVVSGVGWDNVYKSAKSGERVRIENEDADDKLILPKETVSKNGFRCTEMAFFDGNNLTTEACISTEIGVPISVTHYSVRGNVTFTATLSDANV